MVILFDEFHLPESIYEIVFATEQQVIVAKLLIEELKRNGGRWGKTEMSFFANKLHDGLTFDVEKQDGFVKKREKIHISYNKRQFYDRILTPMKSMGMIDYDMFKKQYLVSDKFNKSMIRIGLMWVHELQRQVQ